MEEKRIWELKIDKGFKDLIRPLMSVEFKMLEKSIIENGCENPIIIWNGYIIDGHNRYEICTRNNIPFRVMKKDFSSREAVIAWICTSQLGRRNITEETRKYLIGRLYEAEKIVNRAKNIHGKNQYSVRNDDSTNTKGCSKPESCCRTVEKIADSNHVSHGTVEKYAKYSKAIEKISEKEPEIVTKILSGEYKVSHNGVMELGNMSTAQLKELNIRLGNSSKPYARYLDTKKEIQKDVAPAYPAKNDMNITASVKDMPQYDPDAELAGLTFTIPSWRESIERVMTKADFKNASVVSKKNLMEALILLKEAIIKLMQTTEETQI